MGIARRDQQCGQPKDGGMVAGPIGHSAAGAGRPLALRVRRFDSTPPIALTAALLVIVAGIIAAVAGPYKVYG